MAATDEEIAVFRACLHSAPDFTIKIDDYQWHVHSSVLTRQSVFFEKVCNGPFRESIDKDIKLHDDCPWIVARMIQYLYYGKYEVSARSDPDTNERVLSLMMQQRAGLADYQELENEDDSRASWYIHTLMYEIADKYGVEKLIKTARVQLARSVRLNPDILPAVIESVGVASLQQDNKLCRFLLKSAICQNEKASDIYDEIKELLGQDAGIMEMTHSILVAELDKQRQQREQSEWRNKELLECIEKAYDALVDPRQHTFTFSSPPPMTLESRVGKARQLLGVACQKVRDGHRTPARKQSWSSDMELSS